MIRVETERMQISGSFTTRPHISSLPSTRKFSGESDRRLAFDCVPEQVSETANGFSLSIRMFATRLLKQAGGETRCRINSCRG
jgi:hypothetical protein